MRERCQVEPEDESVAVLLRDSPTAREIMWEVLREHLLPAVLVGVIAGALFYSLGPVWQAFAVGVLYADQAMACQITAKRQEREKLALRALELAEKETPGTGPGGESVVK